MWVLKEVLAPYLVVVGTALLFLGLVGGSFEETPLPLAPWGILLAAAGFFLYLVSEIPAVLRRFVKRPKKRNPAVVARDVKRKAELPALRYRRLGPRRGLHFSHRPFRRSRQRGF